MATAGIPYDFGFYAGATGLIKSDFAVDVFTIDGAAVDADTLASLTVTEVGLGYYIATYTPSVSGRYVLALTGGSDSGSGTFDIDDGTFTDPSSEFTFDDGDF